MSTITFDTQELVRELRTSGLPQEQAEAVVRTMVKSHEGLATASDVARLEQKLDGKFSAIDAKFDAMELRLTVKLGAFMAAAVGILIAVLRAPL